MAMKENSRMVFDFVKGATLAGEIITAKDIEAATGLGPRQVIGCVNAFTRETKGFMVREEMEVLNQETGKHETIKAIKMTAKGLDFDPDAE